MRRITLATLIICLEISGAAMLSGCQGIFAGIYDEPSEKVDLNKNGQLYVDASDWSKWHYIDLTDSNPQWQTYDIPCGSVTSESISPLPEAPGIYTYWYDILGGGISYPEFRGYLPTDSQAEPTKWTLAVHRNNVRTNGCGVYETSYTQVADLTTDLDLLEKLEYIEDEWNQTDVWVVRDKMLSGIIGNQGIYINNLLGSWLKMIIPPMPPSFSLNNRVFVLKLPDGTFAALQLADYISLSGTKCCLTINYKYPL